MNKFTKKQIYLLSRVFWGTKIVEGNDGRLRFLYEEIVDEKTYTLISYGDLIASLKQRPEDVQDMWWSELRSMTPVPDNEVYSLSRKSVLQDTDTWLMAYAKVLEKIDK